MRRINDFVVTAGPQDDVSYRIFRLTDETATADGMVQKAEVEKTEHDIISQEVFCCTKQKTSLI